MKTKIVISVGVLVLSIVGIIVAIVLVKQNQDLRKQASPATNLTLVATSSGPQVESQSSVNVNINTNGNQVVAAQLYISFDPQKLEMTSAIPGTFISLPNKVGPTIDNTTGKLSFALLVPPGSQPKSGQGTLMVLTFKAKAVGSALIRILPESLVGATGENAQNVLLGSSSLTLSIVEPAGTTAPTSSPNPTNSPSSSASPTSSPKSIVINANSGGNPPIPDSGVLLPTILSLFAAAALIITTSLILIRN